MGLQEIDKYKMRFYEFITESLSPIVYHYTSVYNANKIMKSGNFELASVFGSYAEKELQVKKYPYYFSTTRTRFGGFHSTIGSQAAMFVLDGRWFNSRYPSKSVDYWSNSRNPNVIGISGRTHEAEDRVFSKDPTIPIDGVLAIHLYFNPFHSFPSKHGREQAKKQIRQIMIQAKQKNIPAYFYTNRTDWERFDKRKLGNLSILKPEKVEDDTWNYHSDFRGYLFPWIELIQTKDTKNITNGSTLKILSKLNTARYHDYHLKDIVSTLDNDMFNARKPDSGKDRKYLVKIIKFMQKNKLDTVEQLVKFLINKYNK